MHSRQLSRREVIKTFALGAAFSNIIGQSWAASIRYEIRPLSHIETGMLRVDITDFPVLLEPLGSVRIGTSPMAGTYAAGLFPPVIINRGTTGEFYIMSAECTHEGCIVRRLDPDSQRMECPCHQSQYGIDGTRLVGPASQPLSPLPFRRSGNILEIEMSNVFYEITSSVIAGSSRMEISFLSLEAITYEIHFRPSLDGPSERIAFSRTPDGPLTETEIEVPADFAKVYVERPGRFGFFQVVMRTLEV